MKSTSIKTLLHALLIFIGLLSLNAQGGVEITYIHNDASGSPVAGTDEQGNVKWRSHYQPYGEELLGERQMFGVRSGYTGHRDDPETGLTYMGARYYSPIIGRFMGVDPAGVDESNIHSFNRYAYANNNPYKFVDPDGRVPILIPLAIFIAKELAGEAFEQTTGLPAPTVKSIGKRALKAVAKKGAPKRGGDFVDGYRAVSKAEADDIAKHGFRPDPSGRSMQDKWFSESREGAEQFRKTYSDLTEVVHTKVPKNVYDRSYKHTNIDNTGPGFCVQCNDLPLLPKPK